MEAGKWKQLAIRNGGLLRPRDSALRRSPNLLPLKSAVSSQPGLHLIHTVESQGMLLGSLFAPISHSFFERVGGKTSSSFICQCFFLSLSISTSAMPALLITSYVGRTHKNNRQKAQGDSGPGPYIIRCVRPTPLSIQKHCHLQKHQLQ